MLGTLFGSFRVKELRDRILYVKQQLELYKLQGELKVILTSYDIIIAPLKKVQKKLQAHIEANTGRIETLNYKKEELDKSINTSFNEIRKSKATESNITKLLG